MENKVQSKTRKVNLLVNISHLSHLFADSRTNLEFYIVLDSTSLV